MDDDLVRQRVDLVPAGAFRVGGGFGDMYLLVVGVLPEQVRPGGCVVDYELPHVPPGHFFVRLEFAPPLDFSISVFDDVEGAGAFGAFADRCFGCDHAVADAVDVVEPASGAVAVGLALPICRLWWMPEG